MLTVPQAAKRLGVSSDTLYNWHKAGKLEIEFVNDKRRLVKLEDIQRIESERVPEGMKKCSTCGKVDPVNMFVPGFSKHPECLKEEKTKWRKDHQKDINKRKAQSYKDNPLPSIERAKKYYDKNKDKVYLQQVQKRYGIKPEEYLKMCVDRNDRCEICGSYCERLAVDHDHDTGEVRGLLCRLCNSGLGHLKDDPRLVIKALEYLYRYNSKCISKEEYMGCFLGGC